MGEAMQSSTQMLLESRDQEISILRPQLARRDTALQDAETTAALYATRLRHKDEEIKDLKVKNEKLQTLIEEKSSDINRWRHKFELEHKQLQEMEDGKLNQVENWSTKLKETYMKENESLRLQNEQMKAECERLIREKELEERLHRKYEEESAKRKEQAAEFAEKWQTAKERIKQLTESVVKKDRTIGELRDQIENMKNGTSNEALALTTKLEQKRSRILELEDELRSNDRNFEKQLRDAKLDLDEAKREVFDIKAELQQSKHDIVLKNAELETIRSRLGLDTPKKSIDRSREDILVQHIQMLTAKIDNWHCSDLNHTGIPDLREEMGVLKTTNAHLEEKLNDIRREKMNLEAELAKCQEEVQSLKGELERLRKLLDEKQVDNDTTSKFLLDEQSKLKQQKAEIRMRLLEAERELARLQTGNDKVKAEKLEASEIALQAEVDQLKKQSRDQKLEVEKMTIQKESVEKKLSELQAKQDRKQDSNNTEVKELRLELGEMQEKHTRLEEDYKKTKKEFALIKSALSDIDEQCNLLETANERLKAQLADKEKELLEQKYTTTIRSSDDLQEEVKKLMRERDHLSSKSAQLQEELTATHEDYRDQLQKDGMKLKMALQEKSDALQKLAHLETKDDGFESERRLLQERLEELKKHVKQAEEDKNRLFEEMTVTSDRLVELRDENEKLKAGLSQAVQKLERDKALRQDMETDLQQIKMENDELNRKLETESKDKDRLQSRMDLRASASPKGATLTRMQEDLDAKANDIDALETELSQEKKARMLLETRYKQTAQDLVELKRNVLETESAGVARQPSPRPPASPTKKPLQKANSISSQSSSASSTKSKSHTMRHEIPHRWKKFFVIRPGKCVACLEGLPFAKHALKCHDCDLVVHRSCARNLANTCGIPMMYTDYYLDIKKDARRESVHQTSSEEGRMTGWVKLWRSDKGGEGWKDAWGCMDGMKLAFYPQENIADTPIENINLHIQKWKLHFQAGVEKADAKAINNADVPFLVEIKVIPEDGDSSPYRLYLMAPTLQAKQRWVNALQVVTTRKVFTRRVSSLRIENNGFLHLEQPHNLTVYCAAVLDSEYLMVGAEQGVYYTTLALPEIPCKIEGLEKVYQMEIYADIETVIVIYGPERALGALHLGELRACIGSRNPRVKVTALACDQCIMLTSMVFTGRRYLAVAGPNEVRIMAYSHKLGFFKQTTSYPMTEPASTLKCMGQYLLIGADKFLVADFLNNDIIDFCDAGDNSLSYFHSQAPAMQDYPVASVVIGRMPDGSTETLLAFNYYGVFVDTAGRRSRPRDIEWTRKPLDFAFTPPYLFVVHYDSVEVFEVADISEKDKSPLTPICLMELSCPRILCTGPKQGDLVVAQHKTLTTHLIRINVLENPDLLIVNKDSATKRKQVAFGDTKAQNTAKKFRT